MQIFNELEITEEKVKYECICECIYNVINKSQFFDLFKAKKELLHKIYAIIFNCKNNYKYHSIIKLLIKINDNILQHSPFHYNEVPNKVNSNNDLMPLNMETCYSNDKSLSSLEDKIDALKIGKKKLLQTEYLKTLVDIMVNAFESKYNEDKI